MARMLVVTLRFPPDELAALKQLADERGETLSEYVRARIKRPGGTTDYRNTKSIIWPLMVFHATEAALTLNELSWLIECKTAGFDPVLEIQKLRNEVARLVDNEDAGGDADVGPTDAAESGRTSGLHVEPGASAPGMGDNERAGDE